MSSMLDAGEAEWKAFFKVREGRSLTRVEAKVAREYGEATEAWRDGRAAIHPDDWLRRELRGLREEPDDE